MLERGLLRLHPKPANCSLVFDFKLINHGVHYWFDLVLIDFSTPTSQFIAMEFPFDECISNTYSDLFAYERI